MAGDCGINDTGVAYCIRLKSLNARYNPKITTVNHLANLEELDASGNCGINDTGIVNCICLKELDAHNNPKIINIDHLVNLEYFDIEEMVSDW